MINTLSSCNGIIFLHSIKPPDIIGLIINTSAACSSMFFSADNFDGDITSWDVSSVTNMGGMFLCDSSFTCD